VISLPMGRWETCVLSHLNVLHTRCKRNEEHDLLIRRGGPWLGQKQSCTSETVLTPASVKWAATTTDRNTQPSSHFSVLPEDLSLAPRVWALGLQSPRYTYHSRPRGAAPMGTHQGQILHCWDMLRVEIFFKSVGLVECELHPLRWQWP